MTSISCASDSTSATPSLSAAAAAAAGDMSKLKVSEDTNSNIDINSNSNSSCDDGDSGIPGIKFVSYKDESQLEKVMQLVANDLSEPYSIFTYRYFLLRFPELCILAIPEEGDGEPVGCVVCKIDSEGGDGVTDVPQPSVQAQMMAAEESDGTKEQPLQNNSNNADADNNDNNNNDGSNKPALSGYMAMLAVDTTRRGMGIGTALATRAIRKMRDMGCSSITLETEVSNSAAIRLYEDRLGFVREELLVRYYLNWGDAYRLRLWFD